MNRLVVNPNTPQAWEIQLKPGENSFGRGDATDFTIPDPSVSTRHCRVLVADDGVILQDLGSTNGTSVNGVAGQQFKLENGQALRFGNVDLVYYSDTPAAAPPKPAGTKLRVSLASHAPAAPVAAVAALAEAPPPTAPPRMAGPAAVAGGNRFCKFHPKSLARFFCAQCGRSFCDLCVTTRPSEDGAVRTCRSCGVEVTPLEVRSERVVQRSFYSKLPGAFIYPFRDMGLVVVIFATIAFAAVGFMAGMFAIGANVLFYGFLFLFMQNIIHTTASDESEGLAFPEMDGLIGAALALLGTVLMSFWLTILLLILQYSGIEIPGAFIIASTILGCLYFPMAFLAVAIKDTPLAGNPLVVFPSIMKIPAQYSVAAFVLLSVYGVRKLGGYISGEAGALAFHTHDINTVVLALGLRAVWAFVSFYLLTVSIRILGLLYNSTKDKLGWS